jgi:hypothetical protein
MPKTSNVKLTKGGNMTIQPVGLKAPSQSIKLARFQGGKMPSKKHHSNLVMEIEEPSPKQRRKPRTQQEAVEGMSGRQLQQYLDMKNNEGQLQRNTLGSTRDVLLQEILGTMESQGGKGVTHGEHSSSKGGSKGKGMSLPSMGGGGIVTTSLLGGRMVTTPLLGGNLDKIVKNDMRLKHLRDMGVRLENYSPYLVKAVIDGDYRSFRTTNESEWKDLVNECALRGVQVNIMGRKTQFGINLDDFLRNGNMGGEKFNTDDQVNIDMDMDEGNANTFKSGLEGGSMTAVVGRLPTIHTPTKESMLREVISMSINLGYNPALDLLNSFKTTLSQDEYADMYVYLGQNSLPLR